MLGLLLLFYNTLIIQDLFEVYNQVKYSFKECNNNLNNTKYRKEIQYDMD